jgi:hypothetical protein
MEKIELNGAQHLNNYSIVIFRFSIRFASEQLFFAIFFIMLHTQESNSDEKMNTGMHV